MPTVATVAYGPGPSRQGTLYLPDGSAPRPVVVLLHGGFWQARYDRTLMVPLALDLVTRGYAVWNLEYRRVGEPGGGWPGTFDDVAAGIDHLDAIGVDLDVTSTSTSDAWSPSVTPPAVSSPCGRRHGNARPSVSAPRSPWPA